MKIIGKAKLDGFQQAYSDSVASLKRWRTGVGQAALRNFAELRQMLPNADLVGTCVVFNIAQNRSRLIAKVDYEFQTVDVRFILTHKEYSRDRWKEGCK